MKARRRHLAFTILACLSGAAGVALAKSEKAPPATGSPAVANPEIDQLFAAWSKPQGTPGCALGVVRDGKMIYSRGYGMADVEHDAPNTPTTVFHVASVSKQFTAMAIHLLAQDGKLSLDDPVRKHLPELHDFGKPLTIRHLLNHTSGLRDQWALLALSGWRLEDVITERDILDVVWRQKELNFPPGEQFLYSNTGYTLLAVIVGRVSGKPLPEFAKERIFQPLGMLHTHFHDDYGFLVKGRAYSYLPRVPGEYRAVALSFSNVGATSLFTTVEDLARWDENFYSAKVGGKDVLAQMQVKGVLSNGTEIDYASGIEIRQYRGLKIVEHAGGDAGFRSHIVRFPDRHFSAIALCNAGEANPSRLTRKVADLYLAKELGPAPAATQSSKPVEVKIDAKVLDAYEGDYSLNPAFILNIRRNGDQLVSQATGQPPFVLVPASDTSFFPREFEALITFDSAGPDGKSAGLTIRQNGVDTRGTRTERAQPTPERLATYSGTYFSRELNSVYFFDVREGKLFLRHPRGELELQPLTADSFAAPFPVGGVSFDCNASGRCQSFRISSGRIRNLLFDRIELPK